MAYSHAEILESDISSFSASNPKLPRDLPVSRRKRSTSPVIRPLRKSVVLVFPVLVVPALTGFFENVTDTTAGKGSWEHP